MSRKLENWRDAEYAMEVQAARLRGPRLAALTLNLSVILFFVVLIVWANQAMLDEVTRGQGKVIPSSEVQIVQNLEGGILKDVLVKEGEVVETGQVMLRIDTTTSVAALGEQQARYYGLLGMAARLTAEAEGAPLDLPPVLLEEAPLVASREQEAYRINQARLEKELEILRQQIDQRSQEVTELETKLRNDETSLKLVRDEIAISEPLVQRRILPQVRLLQLQREEAALVGEIETTKAAMPRVNTAIEEAKSRVEEKQLSYRSEARAQLNQARAELAGLEKTILAAEDRLVRTEVRSPMKGIVKQIRKKTLGGVIRPGEDLVEVVPVEDTLLVEARVRPSDIAFIRPDLKATVKLTAYDYSIYGGLQGQVERISADTIRDEETGEDFYLVIVRTDKNTLEHKGEVLPIIPGMVATIDILTGEKSVLDYVLKPILKTQQEALRER
ncbi:MAG: HlyD family type I secretion periplasmic adaptor subunit [Magnetospiraceae bacterium]